MRFLKCAVFVIVAASATTAADAGVMLVTTEGAITAEGTTTWSSLGNSFTPVPQPFVHSISGIAGLNATVSKGSAGDFQRRDQLNGWNGNFAPNEPLLWTNNTPGPLRIEFDAAVEGAGAQIQRDSLGTFSGTIEAFDTGGASLGIFNFNGISTGGNNDSAIFVGLLSDMGNIIGAIEFNVANNADFAINDVQVQQADAAVPEPASIAVWCALLLIVFVAKCFLHRRNMPQLVK